EIDDAAGDLVEPGKTRLLVGDLRRRWLADDLVARLQAGGCRWHAALGLALSRRRSGRWIGRRRRGGDTGGSARLRRRDGNPGLGVLRNDSSTGRRRQRLALH